MFDPNGQDSWEDLAVLGGDQDEPVGYCELHNIACDIASGAFYAGETSLCPDCPFLDAEGAGA